jgi:hypothetical protein
VNVFVAVSVVVCTRVATPVTGRACVEVHDGAVSIDDTFDDATDRHVATVLDQPRRRTVNSELVGGADRGGRGRVDLGPAHRTLRGG